MIDETEIDARKIPFSAFPRNRLAAKRQARYRLEPLAGDRPLKQTGANAGADRAAAEQLGVEALAFIAADPKLLPRFLAISGIEAGDIRRAAATPGFLAGVLQFIAAHEPTLMQFAEATGRDPASLTHALSVLPFGDDGFDRST